MKRFLPLLFLLALAGPAAAQVVPTSPLNCGNFPALTGDVTSPATSCTTTLTAGSASNLNSGTLPAARLPSNAIWIGRQLFSSGSATYTPTSGTNEVRVRCVGGGGAGGSAAANGAGNASIGGGGGAGGYTEARITSSFSGVTVAIGTAGAAAAAGANPGGNGGNTTFGALLTANGGTGGSAGTTAAAGGIATGGTGGSATGGDINSAGQTGGYGVTNITSAVMSGGGGSNPLGFGAPATATQTNITGLAGAGRGSGGSGGASAASQGAVAGGAGTAGLCVVDEFR